MHLIIGMAYTREHDIEIEFTNLVSLYMYYESVIQ